MVLSLFYGGITHHYLASNLPYCNRINNNSFGTIHNEYVIGLIGDEDFKVGVLSGKDSACGNILGPITTTKLSDNVDFVLGGYNTNFDKFHKLAIEPPSIGGTPFQVRKSRKDPLGMAMIVLSILSVLAAGFALVQVFAMQAPA